MENTNIGPHQLTKGWSGFNDHIDSIRPYSYIYFGMIRYLPTCRLCPRMSRSKMATITVPNGPNADENTGPFFLITRNIK